METEHTPVDPPGTQVFRLQADVLVSVVNQEVDRVSESEAFRRCPHCATEGIPMLVVYPRLVSGSATNWKCRSCNRYWSDTQLLVLSAS